MNDVKEGEKAPDFSMPVSDGRTVSLADVKGKSLVLYFYPKDNTKGCTVEAIAFSALADEFASAGAIVIGVSPDTLESHARFEKKHDLTVLLGSDEDHAVAQAYGVWKEKNMYGRKFMGIERSTFLLSPDGTVRRVWRKVKVDGHAEAVLAALRDEA
ncbi:thioredoxin-dependent thiol peroxidase [uncultured Martelella sp.]|uniref:thioredoxin-dependent thiol peroxidase n=1 Tax=uncultured Martelella sp. TaxID=392331 RepID=UPI0029C8CBD5|nr:thioredoxin-dependent thiol peroxidase [uncultured Martelella sp.]